MQGVTPGPWRYVCPATSLFSTDPPSSLQPWSFSCLVRAAPVLTLPTRGLSEGNPAKHVRKLKVSLPFILGLGLFPQNMRSGDKDLCLRIFVIILFIMAKI